jgi:hypothetical protein
MLEREAQMAAVEYLVLNGAAFVMEGGALRGSGFFVFINEGEYAFTYFVSAAHVVWSERRQRGAKFPPDGEVSLRINRHGGGIMDIPLKKSDWLYHEDYRFVDLCAVYLDDRKHRYLTDGDVNIANIESLAVSTNHPGIPPVTMMLGASPIGRRCSAMPR